MSRNQVVRKINCENPAHDDRTASCAIYSDGSSYCFGCQAFNAVAAPPEEIEPIIPEDIPAKMAYIDSLPKQIIRGLEFPFDNMGYYVVWPKRDYYKLRRWASDGGRYLSPVGVDKPWFYLEGQKLALFVCEGEINALSLKKVFPDYPVLSPGGVSDFTGARMRKNLTQFREYTRVVIVADSDLVGLKAAVGLKNLISEHVPDVSIVLLDVDCNEMMCGDNGEEKLKETIDGVEMRTGLRRE